MKFNITPMSNPTGTTYRLKAKGRDIGDGVTWEWIGDFTNIKYLRMVQRAMRRGY